MIARSAVALGLSRGRVGPGGSHCDQSAACGDVEDALARNEVRPGQNQTRHRLTARPGKGPEGRLESLTLQIGFGCGPDRRDFISLPDLHLAPFAIADEVQTVHTLQTRIGLDETAHRLQIRRYGRARYPV